MNKKYNNTKFNNYDDYQILSPALMEQIAKAYNDEFKKNNNLKTIINNDLNMYLNIIYNNLSCINKYCTSNYYTKKQAIILEIQTCLNEITTITPSTTKFNFLNYCNLITCCITELTKALNFCINNVNNNNNYITIHNSLCKLMPKLCSLIGECRYREK